MRKIGIAQPCEVLDQFDSFDILTVCDAEVLDQFDSLAVLTVLTVYLAEVLNNFCSFIFMKYNIQFQNIFYYVNPCQLKFWGVLIREGVVKPSERLGLMPW